MTPEDLQRWQLMQYLSNQRQPLDYNSWLQMTGQAPVGQPTAQVKGGVDLAKLAASLAIKKGASSLLGAGAGEAASAGASSLASSAAANAAWNAAADAATAQAAGSGALGAAGSTAPLLGPAASAGITVAAPLIVGTLLQKAFFKDKPKRQFNASEIAKDKNPGKFNYLNNQIPGYQGMDQSARENLLNSLHNTGANLITTPGYADKSGNTKNRGNEYINWAQYMKPRVSGMSSADVERYQGNKWWNAASSDTPTVEDINKANWLTDSKKNELKAALAIVNNSNQPQAASPNPQGSAPVYNDLVYRIPQNSQTAQTVANATAAPQMHRSQTLSPGIDLNGNIINYSNRKRR